MKYCIGEVFTVGDMSDEFVEVSFEYDTIVWNGALPLKGKYQGYDITIEEIKSEIEMYYNQLSPKKVDKWKEETRKKFENASDTIKVFDALCSGKWECRKCGPVPKVNPQPPARIRDIKKKGCFIATKRFICNNECKRITHHDILIMADIKPEVKKPELRKPISKKLAQRICKLLENKESVFEKNKQQCELVIDHKFPSQRWLKPESDNNDSMTDEEIRNKFQILDNQTNLLKSRECDKCIFTNKRGVFLGIDWYSEGSSSWEGSSFDDEKGCKGCPWYDVLEWKRKLKDKLT